jgi:hypothetical protein
MKKTYCEADPFNYYCLLLISTVATATTSSTAAAPAAHCMVARATTTCPHWAAATISMAKTATTSFHFGERNARR